MVVSGGEVYADREIIKPDDADLVRNFVSELLTLNHRGIGDQIMVADNRGDSQIQQTGKMLFHTLSDIVGTSRIGRIGL